jgi:fumarate hydratase class II
MFTTKLLSGLKANRQRIESMNEKSLALATSLAPRIGYDLAAEIAKESFKTGKTVREIAVERRVLPLDELNKVLDLKRQTEPGV